MIRPLHCNPVKFGMNSSLRSRAMVVAALLSLSIPIVHADDDDDQLTTIVVTSTRHPRLIGEEPLRVEAVPAEEIAENSTVRVGDVTSLLQELPGVRFDVGSGGLGAVGLHLRGLPARHTLLLRDGLPSSGAGPTGFGLLQMPPIDLQRVEVVKGVATPLYGSSALAGVLNLVSVDGPGESVVTTDVTSRGADNLVALLRSEDDSWPNASMTVARSRQARADIDGDRWFEIPGYERLSVRPRITLQDGAGRSLFVTAAATNERRVGGTADSNSLLGTDFYLMSNSQNREVGLIARASTDDGAATEFRGSHRQLQRVLRVGGRIDDTRQRMSWFEVTHAKSIGAHDWLIGATSSLESLRFDARTDLAYARSRSGVFFTDSFSIPSKWSWQFAGRYETVQSMPLRSSRLAALYQASPSTNVRISLGQGESAPTYEFDELADLGIGALRVARANRSERINNASLDVDWKDEDLELVVGVFHSKVERLLDLRRTIDGRFDIVNSSEPLRIAGVEGVARYVEGSWHVMASWAGLSTRFGDGNSARQLPLTPRYTGELAMLYEVARVWRVGLEFALTGRQMLDDANASSVPSTCEISVLAARRFGNVTVFVNAMNLNDVRQTKREPFLRTGVPSSLIPTRDVWSSLSGRIINIGARIEI